jgi:hypothetical protein
VVPVSKFRADASRNSADVTASRVDRSDDRTMLDDTAISRICRTQCSVSEVSVGSSSSAPIETCASSG